jgi:hypothetical protein
VALVAGSLAAGAAGAQANGPGDPLIGDIDGDGRTDRVTLGATSHGDCAVFVELGKKHGGFRHPKRYTFDLPGDPPTCPDMGVIVDLAGDGDAELVLAFFDGSFIVDDLVVLDDFDFEAGFEGIFQPSAIGLADFDGDGLVDVYEFTDQGDGFQSFLNTPAGELVPGPVAFAAGIFDFELADVDEDGGTDLVMSFAERFPAQPETGVVVVVGDGSQTFLTEDGFAPSGFLWDVQVVDLNADGHLDVRLVDPMGPTTLAFLGDGDGNFTPA